MYPLLRRPDRRLLPQLIDRALPRARGSEPMFAVLLIELERRTPRAPAESPRLAYTPMDALSELTDDQLVRQVSARLESCLRQSDLVARYGTNEFVVVLQHLGHDSEARLVALALMNQLGRAFTFNDQNSVLGVNVGVSLYPNDGEDTEALLSHAETALGRARTAERQSLHFYNGDLQTDMVARRALEADLQVALDQNQLLVLYQPVYHLPERRLSGVEALLRWNHPEHGLIGPDVFLSTAEQSGLIEVLGRWVVAEVCRQSGLWTQQGFDVPVCINISSRQFGHGLPIAWLHETLTRHRVRPWAVTFEITEHALMSAGPAVREWLHELALLCINIALDDFGAANVTPEQLIEFNIRQLKINPSLLHSPGEDDAHHSLVKSILKLGKTMNLPVTAKCVEDVATLAALQAADCMLAQGFYLAHPLPAQEVHALADRMPHTGLTASHVRRLTHASPLTLTPSVATRLREMIGTTL